MTQQLAAQIAIEGIFYSGVAFIIAVSLFWPWWKSQLGWTIIAKTVTLSLAVLPAMLMYWFGIGTPRWLMYVSILALWAIPPILAWRAIVLWRVQRHGLEHR